MSGDRVGLLIIRAWIEVGSSAPLRAQLRWTTDVSLGLEHQATLADVAAVHAAVDAWLAAVLATADEGGNDSGDPVTPA